MWRLGKDIAAHRELLGMLVGRNLKIRYKSSVLGFFWSLLTPLFFIGIYAVFARILRFNDGRPGYLQFLIVGIIIWQFLSMCLNDSLGAIVGNSNLVKKTAFPRIVLPLAMVLANLINFLLTCLVLGLYLFLAPVSSGVLLWLLPALLTQCALCLGLALLLSAGNVFFRDTEHILGVLQLAWFFLTPIFYPVDMQMAFFPPTWSWLVFLNPMTGILSVYRAALVGDVLPAAVPVLVSFLVAWGLLVMGVMVFEKVQVLFGDEL